MAQTMSSSTCTGAILSTKVPRRHPGRQPMMSSRTDVYKRQAEEGATYDEELIIDLFPIAPR